MRVEDCPRSVVRLLRRYDVDQGDAAEVCAHLAGRRLDEEDDGFTDLNNWAAWCNLAGALCCVCFAALAAGLTMGIVSLEALDLRVKLRTGDDTEKSFARRLLPLVEREPHHQVLVTLLLVNSLANEALPLFLDELVPSWFAIVLSVSAVLFLGEIVPSAVFTGPSKLRVASVFVPLVSGLLVAVGPIAYPVALLLDRWMPEETQFTTRQEVHALVEVERDLAHELGAEAPFTEDESSLVRGTLQLASKRVQDVMVPIDRVFAVDADKADATDTISQLASSGFSRVPLRARQGDNASINRYILVKELVGLRPGDDVSRAVREPLWTSPDHSLFALLHEFQSGTSHIAFVKKARPDSLLGLGVALGVVTLEDIIEAIMRSQIYDETDRNNAARTISNFLKRYAPLSKKATSTSYDDHPPHPRSTGNAAFESPIIASQRRRASAMLSRQTSRIGLRRGESSKAVIRTPLLGSGTEDDYDAV